jgi:UDP-N-acetylglucosamine 2-epimerase
LWPNIDAGSDHISKVIRLKRLETETPWIRTMTNLTPDNYLRVLANAACAIGNSSSFVRDAGYFGTPIVLVGNRQNGREHDVHVRPVPVEHDAIVDAIRHQLAHGGYSPSTLYGDGNVSARIAKALGTFTPYLQKRLAFTTEG